MPRFPRKSRYQHPRKTKHVDILVLIVSIVAVGGFTAIQLVGSVKWSKEALIEIMSFPRRASSTSSTTESPVTNQNVVSQETIPVFLTSAQQLSPVQSHSAPQNTDRTPPGPVASSTRKISMTLLPEQTSSAAPTGKPTITRNTTKTSIQYFHEVPLKEFSAIKGNGIPYLTAFSDSHYLEERHSTTTTSKKICQDTCCAEPVYISMEQDEHHIINTLDGLDIADLLVQQYSNHDEIQFFAHQLHPDMLPCLQAGTIIHVDNHGDLLAYFFDVISPKITQPYVLITSESDADSPFERDEMLIQDTHLLKWFGTNPNVERLDEAQKQKFEGLPLGLAKFHEQSRFLTRFLELTSFANPFANKDRWNQSILVSMARDSSDAFQELEEEVVDRIFYQTLFVKFNIHEDDYGNRAGLYRNLCSGVNATTNLRALDDNISCHAHKVKPRELYAAASRYLFGMSPKGEGHDCYRTYEFLLLGVIPVVPARAGGSHGLYQDLPVLELEDFDKQRTRSEYLQIFRAYIESPEFQNTDFEKGWNKLFLWYWRRRLLEVGGRLADTYRDPESGKEYYQGWRYTTPTPAPRQFGVPKDFADKKR